MARIFRFIYGILLILAIIVAIYLVHKYSYVETVEISILNNDGTYLVIDSYRYNVNDVKKYYMLTNTIINNKISEAIICKYRLNINNTDIICYDGGNYAEYTTYRESLDDYKDAIKDKNISSIDKSVKSSKIIAMNKDLAKLLKSFD